MSDRQQGPGILAALPLGAVGFGESYCPLAALPCREARLADRSATATEGS